MKLTEEVCRNAFQYIADGTVKIDGNSIYNPYEEELCIFEQLINEHFNNKKETVYLCDRLAFKSCSDDYCKHTSKIEHARNFEEIGGVYFENERRVKEVKDNEWARNRDY